MTWHPYGLDEKARRLVKDALQRDTDIEKSKRGFKEAYKMRETVVYGLERFWGEAQRYDEESQIQAEYWRRTWNVLVEILGRSGIQLPNHHNVLGMADDLWNLNRGDQQIALVVLTQLCDCMVWWSQRYKNDINNNHHA
jgi:hypothetical protein